MVALYIILGILLLLFLILMLSVHVYAFFDESLTLTLRVLFVRYTILSPDKEKKEKKEKKPKKPKKPKKKKPEEPKQEEEKEEKQSLFQKLRDKHGLPGLLSLLTELVRIATGLLKGLFSHIVIHKFDVGIAFNGGDAANTAETYGKLCGAVYGSVNILAGICVLRDYHVAIEPVFDASRPTRAYANVHLHMRLIRVVGEALKAAFRAGALWLKARYGKA